MSGEYIPQFVSTRPSRKATLALSPRTRPSAPLSKPLAGDRIGGAAKGRGRKRQEQSAAPPAAAERQAPQPAGGQPDMLDALESVKQLVDQFGADRVKRMVDLLGG